MAKVSFNGVNREIVILPGIESIDAQIDLYSEWKNWVQSSNGNGSNSRFPAAFRTFGGDTTIVGQFAPRYFFLINNWEILASSVSVSIQTNLYTDTTGTTGVVIDNAAVIVRNSDAPIVDAGISESLDYMGIINIDVLNGDAGIVWPYGTIAQPVNNLSNALTIADVYGISNFSVKGPLTIDQDFIGNEIFGADALPPITFLNSPIVNNTTFRQLLLSGTVSITDGAHIFIDGCIIDDNGIYGVNGVMSDTIIRGNIGLSPNEQPRHILMKNCVAGNIGTSEHGSGYPEIISPAGTYSGTSSILPTTTEIQVRNYTGAIALGGDFGTGSSAIFEIDPGSVHIEPEVRNGGTIIIRGVGDFVLDNPDIIVDTSGLYYDIENTTQVNSYRGIIIIDSIDGASGSVYPLGTNAAPVNNLDDALILSDLYNIDIFEVYHGLTISQDISNKSFISPGFPPRLYIDNATASDSTFRNVIIQGTFSATSQLNQTLIFDSIIYNLDNFYGVIDHCGLGGEISLGRDSIVSLNNARSYIPGNDSPVVSKYQGHTASVSFNNRAYSGGLRVKGWNNPADSTTLEYIAGKANIDASCIDGTIVVRGVGSLNNEMSESTNVTLDLSGFLYDIELNTHLTAYDGVINLHSTEGFTGSVYPIGTNLFPVNNPTDALLLSETYGIHHFNLLGVGITFSNVDLSNKTLSSEKFPPKLVIDNCTVSRTNFVQVDISGTFSNTDLSNPILIENSMVGNIDNFNGIIYNSGLGGEITLSPNATATFTDCKSVIPGTDSPVVSKYNGHTASVSFNNRAYSGGLRLKDWNNPGDVTTLEYIAGRANIDPTCVDGLIVIRGVGTLNNETGTASNVTIITDGFTSDLHDSLERVEPEVFRIGTVVDNLTGSTSSEVYDLLQSVAGTVSLIYSDTTNILSDTTDILVDVDTIITKIDAQSILLNQIAGLTQKNYRIFNQTYDTEGCLTQATIKTYPTATDATNNTNEDYTYEMSASYDVDSRLIDYKVIEV